MTSSGEKVWEYVNPFFDRSAQVIELSEQEVFKKRRLFRAERYEPTYLGLSQLSG